MWAKAMWGAYWNWDPARDVHLLPLLVYAAYLALRSAIDGRRAARAPLGGLFVVAFVTVPFLIFVVPRIYFSLHPIRSSIRAASGHGPAHSHRVLRPAGWDSRSVFLAPVAARARGAAASIGVPKLDAGQRPGE
jgi:hypothetical protein